MRLYFTPGTCSLSPHIVAREAGLDIELVAVDIATKTTERGERYTQINPKGYVPALVLDNGFILTEGPAIVQLLADLAPAAELIPGPASLDRYVAQEWLNFISTELHKGFSPLWRKDTPADMRRLARDNLATRFSFLDQHLADKPYILGDRFSVADAYAFTVLQWAKVMAIDLGRWSNVTAYLERIAARPKVRETMIVEGLIPAESEAA
jgi:glutathione S-transferase